MYRWLIRLFVPMLVLVAIPAMAVDGQIPIPFASPIATPITITTPGSYVVTQNLVPTGPGPIIIIAVPGIPGDVQIDLNGFVLDNTPNAVDPVIQVIIGAASEVTVRNGALTGGSAGIEAFGPGRKLVVEDVKISDFTALGPPAGIYMLDVFNFAIRRNVIVDTAAAPGGPAIWIDGGIPRQGTIEDNLIRRTADGIISLPLAASIEISNNRLIEILPGGPFGAAINLDGAESCLIAQNTFHGGFLGPVTGINLNFSQGCKIYNNTVVNMGNNGISLFGGSDGNLVLDNVVRSSGADGIFVDGAFNHVEGNVLTGNGAAGVAGFGLHFGPGSFDNTYGRNTSRGNIGAGPCAFVAPVEPCAAIGGGGSSFPPEFCNESLGFFGNTSFCDNLMPGPPRS
jgi:parallel beta-helix repeat protein